MRKMSVVLGIVLLTGFAGERAIAGEIVDSAPSGQELSHISTDERAAVETPGRDAPASEAREGNVISIDMDRDHNVGSADARDTTVEHDTPDRE